MHDNSNQNQLSQQITHAVLESTLFPNCCISCWDICLMTSAVSEMAEYSFHWCKHIFSTFFSFSTRSYIYSGLIIATNHKKLLPVGLQQNFLVNLHSCQFLLFPLTCHLQDKTLLCHLLFVILLQKTTSFIFKKYSVQSSDLPCSVNHKARDITRAQPHHFSYVPDMKLKYHRV